MKYTRRTASWSPFSAMDCGIGQINITERVVRGFRRGEDVRDSIDMALLRLHERRGL
jgi:hypothetical protein